MGRSLDDLRRDQEAILNTYRAAKQTADTVPGSSVSGTAAGGGYAFGRVQEVVLSDPTYGPHVQVVRQAWSGMPPTPADAGVGPVRCYPAPGQSISAFAQDDVVRMIYVSGAILVEPTAT